MSARPMIRDWRRQVRDDLQPDGSGLTDDEAFLIFFDFGEWLASDLVPNHPAGDSQARETGSE